MPKAGVMRVGGSSAQVIGRLKLLRRNQQALSRPVPMPRREGSSENRLARVNRREQGPEGLRQLGRGHRRDDIDYTRHTVSDPVYGCSRRPWTLRCIIRSFGRAIRCDSSSSRCVASLHPSTSSSMGTPSIELGFTSFGVRPTTQGRGYGVLEHHHQPWNFKSLL